MSLALYYHPFSSYSQKALIAFYELGLPFEPHLLGDPDGEPQRTLAARWPMRQFPMLLDGDRQVNEATCIVEYLDLLHGEHRLLPADPQAALSVRLLDRFFDLHVMSPMQAVVSNALRPAEHRDPYGVRQARERLHTAYGWLEQQLAQHTTHGRGHGWAAGGEAFTLADCAAAPSLFYADWVEPLGDAYPQVQAYRARLLARPSFARAVDEARPFRSYFPLGAPDRD